MGKKIGLLKFIHFKLQCLTNVCQLFSCPRDTTLKLDLFITTTPVSFIPFSSPPFLSVDYIGAVLLRVSLLHLGEFIAKKRYNLRHKVLDYPTPSYTPTKLPNL